MPNERVVALQVGIDRPVVRAALRQLAVEGTLAGPKRGRYWVVVPEGCDEWWMIMDIARHFRVSRNTVASWRFRKRLPKENKMIGRRPVWRPGRIKAWRRPDT